MSDNDKKTSLRSWEEMLLANGLTLLMMKLMLFMRLMLSDKHHNNITSAVWAELRCASRQIRSDWAGREDKPRLLPGLNIRRLLTPLLQGLQGHHHTPQEHRKVRTDVSTSRIVFTLSSDPDYLMRSAARPSLTRPSTDSTGQSRGIARSEHLKRAQDRFSWV